MVLWWNDYRKSGSVWTVCQKYTPSKTNSSNEKDRRKTAHWTKLRPMYSSEIDSKSAETNHHLSVLLEMIAIYFLKTIDRERQS